MGRPMSDDQDDCMDRIGPILDDLYEALYEGMAVYQNPEHYSALVIAQQRSRTAKSCVYDHAFHSLRDRLEDRKGCAFRNVRGLEVLNFNDLAVIRLKQVNGSGRSRNYPTKQQRDYDDQKSFLPFIPDAAKRLVIGYEPDTVFSAVDRIIAARPMGRDILWTSQILKLEKSVAWIDISPARIDGTDRADFSADRRRGGR